MKTVFTFIGSAILVSCSSAQVTKSGNMYTFNMKFTKGQVFRQQVQIAMTGPQTMNSTMIVSSKVLSVDKSGTARIEVSTPASKIMGQDVPAKVQTISMDRNGKSTSEAAASSSVYPLKPLAIGQTFRGKTISNGVAVDANMKFLGLINKGGVQVAEFDVIVNATTPMKISGTGKTYINVSNGQVWAGGMNMKMTLPAGAGGKNAKPIRMNLSVNSKTL